MTSRIVAAAAALVCVCVCVCVCAGGQTRGQRAQRLERRTCGRADLIRTLVLCVCVRACVSLCVSVFVCLRACEIMCVYVCVCLRVSVSVSVRRAHYRPGLDTAFPQFPVRGGTCGDAEARARNRTVLATFKVCACVRTHAGDARHW